MLNRITRLALNAIATSVARLNRTPDGYIEPGTVTLGPDHVIRVADQFLIPATEWDHWQAHAHACGYVVQRHAPMGNAHVIDALVPLGDMTEINHMTSPFDHDFEPVIPDTHAHAHDVDPGIVRLLTALTNGQCGNCADLGIPDGTCGTC